MNELLQQMGLSEWASVDEYLKWRQDLADYGVAGCRKDGNGLLEHFPAAYIDSRGWPRAVGL